jgi:signal peptidase I
MNEKPDLEDWILKWILLFLFALCFALVLG